MVARRDRERRIHRHNPGGAAHDPLGPTGAISGHELLAIVQATSINAWLVSFAPDGMADSQRSLAQSATCVGLRGSFEWDTARLRQLEPFRRHPRLFDRLQNRSLALWRPAVILSQLRELADGELLIYHDVGSGYWGPYVLRVDVSPILRWAVEHNGGILPGVWVPELGRNARWTTPPCFARMGCEADRFRDTPHLQATYSVWQRSDRALTVLQNWMEACVAVYDCDPTGDAPNAPDFRQDLGSQSVLTNLVVRDAIGSFGEPYESTAIWGNPAYPPVPATEIETLAARIQAARILVTPAAPAPADGVAPPSTRRALFTSIPPRMTRLSASGFDIGETYQRRCVESWRRSGFDIYSIHFQDDLAAQPRLEGVNYIGVTRDADDPPYEPKPSMRAIIGAIRKLDADISGIINADILLMDAPGWLDVVDREIGGSVIAFTRYESQDIDRACTGTPPWGLDLFLFDTKVVGNLLDCGMRIGETWWDYWFPLACYFAGARLKHVGDCFALHLDHPITSSKNVMDFGRRLLGFLESASKPPSASAVSARASEFHRRCLHRFDVEAERQRIADRSSLGFIGEVVNPTVWIGIAALLARDRIHIVPEGSAYQRKLTALMADTVFLANRRLAQDPWQAWLARRYEGYVKTAKAYLARRGTSVNVDDAAVIAYAEALRASPLGRAAELLSGLVRSLRGRRRKPHAPITTIADALAFLVTQDTRPGRRLLRLVETLRPTRRAVRHDHDSGRSLPAANRGTEETPPC